MLFDAGAIAIAAKRSRLWGVPEAGAVPSTPFVLAVQVLVLVFFISGLLFFIYLLFLQRLCLPLFVGFLRAWIPRYQLEHY